mmetsp:Transcript_54470/g.129750  ORF Transcript_54470/g.129750 Transcript_54470/m.129750 type:complete len:449 (-) Transcript_54470:140-1486(-)
MAMNLSAGAQIVKQKEMRDERKRSGPGVTAPGRAAQKLIPLNLETKWKAPAPRSAQCEGCGPGKWSPSGAPSSRAWKCGPCARALEEAYMTRLRSIVGMHSREATVSKKQAHSSSFLQRTKDNETAELYKVAVNTRMPKTIPWAVDRQCFCFETLEGKPRVSPPDRRMSRSVAPGASHSGPRSISFAAPIPTATAMPVFFSPNSSQHQVARAIPGYTGHFEGGRRSMGETFGTSVGRNSLASEPLYNRQPDDFVLCRSGYPSFQTRPWEIRPSTAQRKQIMDPVNRMPREGVVQIVASALMARVTPKARWPMNKCLLDLRRAWVSLTVSNPEYVGVAKLRQILASLGVEMHDNNAQILVSQLHLAQDPPEMVRLEVLTKALEEHHNRHPLSRPKSVRPHRCFTALGDAVLDAQVEEARFLSRPQHRQGFGARSEELRIASSADMNQSI